MDYNKFRDISCYEEFEIQCDLHCISKNDVLNKIGHQINDYYFFISNNGIFNWFDLSVNHVENPGILKEIIEEYIPKNITKCIIPNGVENIVDYTFYNCNSLKEIIIPNSVEIIKNNVFSCCRSLEEITIPNSVTSIGCDAFSSCKSLRKITVHNSLTYIRYNAFYDCISLKEITIPNSVISIDDWAFGYCKSLTSITIPDSVTYIGVYAFYGCDSLKEVIFKGKTLEEVKQMEKYPFGIADESIIKCEI